MRFAVRPLVLAAALVCLLACAPLAGARTIVLGSSLKSFNFANQQCLLTGCTLMQTALDGAVLAAPEAGTITSWRGLGQGTARLRVLRPVGDGSFRGVATSATATLGDQPVDFAVSLPVAAGDRIAIDLDGHDSTLYNGITENARMAYWTPALADGSSSAPTDDPGDNELLFNATLEVPDAAPTPGPPSAPAAPTTGASAPPPCTVPHLVGHSVRAARRAVARSSKRCHLRLVLHGASRSRVRHQSPAAGRRVAPGARVTASTRR
jgi:hypothetical protein